MSASASYSWGFVTVFVVLVTNFVPVFFCSVSIVPVFGTVTYEYRLCFGALFSRNYVDEFSYCLVLLNVMLPSYLSTYWHPAHNIDWVVDNAFPMSTKSAWWLGSCGHEWERRIAIQNKLLVAADYDDVRTCPVCSGSKVTAGLNDLATTHPEVASLWSSDNERKATEFSKASIFDASWVCPEGHEWKRKIKNQVNVKTSCKECSRKEPWVMEKRRLLKDSHAELVKQINFDKNENLDLDSLSTSSNQSVSWICQEGHEWDAKVVNRSTLGRGCPFCSGRYAIEGVNDLTTTHPHIVASFWDYDKNTTFGPNEVKAGSSKNVWWKCAKGHSWENKVTVLTLKNHGCPFCSGKRIIAGETSLADKRPDLVKLWHPTKNGSLLPSEVSAANRKKVWWQCELKHEWKTEIYSVSFIKPNTSTGCPVCSGKEVLIGFNDAESVNPELTAEWHPTKNLDKKLSDFTYGSGKTAWWKCAKGHEWRTSIDHRTNKNVPSGCPSCRTPFSKAEKAIVSILRNNGLVVEENIKGISGGKTEVDIYIPDLKIAVEFNGVYWHSDEKAKDENGKNVSKWRHYNKWLNCKERNIQLIQIWEDDWNTKEEIITKSLLRKLNADRSEKVFARQTKIVNLTVQQSKQFFMENHIQGFMSGSIYQGLEDKRTGIIVAAMILTKQKSSQGLRLDRYATSCNVPGGFSKLLKHMVEENPWVKKIVTFSDHCVSDGGLYENNGFVADKEIPPDYMYVVKGKRNHKFGYRLKKFKNDPELLWDEKLSESELAELNGLPRIWDAGKTRWVRTL